MDNQVQKLINTEDSTVAVDAIQRMNQHFDFIGCEQEYRQFSKSGMHREANKVLLRIIGAMTTTIAKLEKQNALMETDYRRQGKGRK